MPSELKDAKTIWNNTTIPVVLRRGGTQAIRLRLRYAKDNRSWLKAKPRNKDPYWDKQGKYWELPASRFNEIVTMLLNRFSCVYIIQPYREKEVCARSCMEAEGFECQCSCMGANHGSGMDGGWFEVSDAFAVRYGGTKLACRLLHKTETNNGAKQV
jgi:hypothetical protein